MEVNLLAIQGAREPQEIRLKAAETVIGRQKGCGLRIPSATVSRRHCRLRVLADSLTVEDLGSANGSYLNGQRVTGVQVARPGDQLQIGPVTFRVEYQAAPQPAGYPPPPPPPQPAGFDEPQLMPPMPLGEFVEALALDTPVPAGEFVEAIPLEEPVVPPAGPANTTAAQPDPVPAPPPSPDPAFDADGAWHLPEGQDLHD